MRRLLLLMLTLLMPVALAAQDPRLRPAEDRTPRRLATTGYTLAMSWTPEYCHAARGERAAAPECRGPSAAGFTLHGLWPDGADPKLWPQYCHAGGPLTPAQIRAGSAATPSPRLLQHEWDKHGSCMAADPATYFAEEGKLYRAIRFPDMAALARRRDLTAGAVTRAFADANPGVRPDMLRLDLNKRGWLSEVWLCLGLDKRPRACPAGAQTVAAGTRVRVQAPPA